MELWIRTQDREKLMKVDYINIEETPQGHGYKEYYIGTKGTLFGTYKTKERALEVLDDIDKLMRELCDSDLKIIPYEMPKE